MDCIYKDGHNHLGITHWLRHALKLQVFSPLPVKLLETGMSCLWGRSDCETGVQYKL